MPSLSKTGLGLGRRADNYIVLASWRNVGIGRRKAQPAVDLFTFTPARRYIVIDRGEKATDGRPTNGTPRPDGERYRYSFLYMYIRYMYVYKAVVHPPSTSR